MLQLTALTRMAVPTPIIDPLTTCVVDTGKCNNVAVKIVIAEFKSAANPLILSNLKILLPTVAIIFQPPAAVPNAIAVAQAILTQIGTSKVCKCPLATKVNVIMPIAFCASLDPCENDIKAADTNCIFRNRSFKIIGENRPNRISSIFITI